MSQCMYCGKDITFNESERQRIENGERARVYAAREAHIAELEGQLAATITQQDANRLLIADGVVARKCAVERLCALGRELDGAAFDADAWRSTMAAMSLDEIHSQLRAFEVRFNQKYTPRLSYAEECDGCEELTAVTTQRNAAEAACEKVLNDVPWHWLLDMLNEDNPTEDLIEIIQGVDASIATLRVIVDAKRKRDGK